MAEAIAEDERRLKIKRGAAKRPKGRQGRRGPMRSFWGLARATALIAVGALIIPNMVMPNPAQAADPIRIGMSMALTGGVAPIGKQVLTALQIWRDDVNAKGGLLGRPVELVFYDDQSNPANVPQLYTKLIDVDKVDLVIGPYATNMVAPAIPVLMQHKMTTIGILANAANSKFHYDQYFSMPPTARGRPSRRSAASKSCSTRNIRRRRPTTRQSCAPSARSIPTSSSSPPIRRIRSASCAPPTKSASRRKCSAARSSGFWSRRSRRNSGR